MVIYTVVGHGHAGGQMGARTGGHGVARVDSDHAECVGVLFSTPSFFLFVSWARVTCKAFFAVGQYEQNFDRVLRALRVS